MADPVKQMYDTNEEVIPWPENDEESSYPEDGKIIFQESMNSEMLFFNTWEEAFNYAIDWYKKTKWLEKMVWW
jgi:hypothetical protein